MVQADSKMGDKRKLFIPSVIRAVLRHADDLKFGGKVDATMAVKLFLIVLFSKLLIPSTSSHASAEVIKVHDLEHLNTIDWSGLIFNRLWEGILAWQHEESDYANGCLLLPMVHPNILLLLMYCFYSNVPV